MSKVTAPRIVALDGLRGIAALIVLLDHTFLMVPTFDDIYGRLTVPETGTWEWWISLTPLRILWAGPEAVFLFFVLSGLVLTLSVTRRPDFDWAAYYPGRMIRLYLPVWGAVVVSWLAMTLVPRHQSDTFSRWVNNRPAGYEADMLHHDLAILWGGGPFGISPLWSLVWEVRFSLMLPLFVAFVVVGARFWKTKGLLIVAALAVGAVAGWGEFRYLPMFAIGALLAAYWDTITAWLEGFLRRSPWRGVMVFLLAVVLVPARWWLLGLGVDSKFGRGLETIGLTGTIILVLLAVTWSPLRGFLEWRPVHWLGAISFSLYLVHEPIIVTVRHLLPHAHIALVFAVAVAAAILVAWGFYHAVERPATRLSQSWKRRYGTTKKPATSG